MAKAKKTPSGRWRVLLYTGKDENGKRIYRSFTADSRREAEFAASEYAATNHNDGDPSAMTVGEAIDKYIDSKRNIVSPSTLKGYLSIRRNRLAGLRDARLSSLTAETVQRAINFEASALSPKTVRNIFGVLTSTLKMFTPELRFDITLPARKKPDLHIPTPEEISKIYDVVKDTDMEIPFLLASQCGLRRSEICALKWQDIDDTHVTVKNAVVRGPDGYTVKQPKSYAGYREVGCSKALADRLRVLKRGDSDMVCAIDPSNLTSKWLRLLASAGLPHCRFHDLRHYFASMGSLEGIPSKYMAIMMGHSSTAMVDKVYSHIFPESLNVFNDRILSHTDILLGKAASNDDR